MVLLQKIICVNIDVTWVCVAVEKEDCYNEDTIWLNLVNSLSKIYRYRRC